jgi:hypothetical protein
LEPTAIRRPQAMTDDTGWGRVMLGLEGFAVTGVELVADEV